MTSCVDHEEESPGGYASKTAYSDLFQHTGMVSVVKRKNNTDVNENYDHGFHIDYGALVCEQVVHILVFTLAEV